MPSYFVFISIYSSVVGASSRPARPRETDQSGHGVTGRGNTKRETSFRARDAPPQSRERQTGG